MNNQERRRAREHFCEDLRRHVVEFGSAAFRPSHNMDEQFSYMHDAVVVMAFATQGRSIPEEMLSTNPEATLIGCVRKMCREKGWELTSSFALGDEQWYVRAPVVEHRCPACYGRGRIELFSIADGRLPIDPQAIYARVCGQCHGAGHIVSNVAPQLCWLKDNPYLKWSGGMPMKERLPL